MLTELEILIERQARCERFLEMFLETFAGHFDDVIKHKEDPLTKVYFKSLEEYSDLRYRINLIKFYQGNQK